jgi:UDP-N-acetylmuramyl pentapeptide phosphotransferase/UDP-N-acetylglucosamine-1-phosphate transferase
MPLVVELVGNVGSLALIGFFAWAIASHGRGTTAAVFSVVALIAVLLYPMVLSRVLFSTNRSAATRPENTTIHTRPQRRLYPGSVHPLPSQPERPRMPTKAKVYVKAAGMLAIIVLLAKLFGGW